MNIPKEVVEAAARAAYATAESAPWDENPDEHLCWLEEARAALVAAAPFIRAEALREALGQVGTMYAGAQGAPYVSATKSLLRTIADEMEQA